MEITINGKPWRDAARRAGDSIRAGGEKAESAGERRRLRRACRDLAAEIDRQMAAIGELIYATHKGKPADSRDIEEILTYVDGLYEDLTEHRAALQETKGVLICPACGTENPPERFSCRVCGRALDAETV